MKLKTKLALVIIFIITLIPLGCGGGGGNDDESSFATVNGRWRIDAQDLVEAECGVLVGGFTENVTVSTDDGIVTITTPTQVGLTFTGAELPGALSTATTGGSACGDGGVTNYTLTISNIPPTNNTGTVEYTYQSVCADGSIPCSLTARGTAVHLSGSNSDGE